MAAEVGLQSQAPTSQSLQPQLPPHTNGRQGGVRDILSRLITARFSINHNHYKNGSNVKTLTKNSSTNDSDHNSNSDHCSTLVENTCNTNYNNKIVILYHQQK